MARVAASSLKNSWFIRTLRWSGILLASVWLLCTSIYIAHVFADAEGKTEIEHAVLDVADLVRESTFTPLALVHALDDWADTLPIVWGKPVATPDFTEGSLFPYGKPEGGNWLHLKNPGYAVGYDETEHLPRWATYRVVASSQPLPERPSRFRVDRRSESQVRTEAYTRSGYDRGHLAPNRALAATGGVEAQVASFLLTNVVPQLRGLNAGLWRDLEHRIAQRYTRRYGELWVACGPIFDAQVSPRRIGPEDMAIRVPDAFWMIVTERTVDGKMRTVAFLVPHREIWRDSNPSAYLVSIDEIERLTKLDFFSELPAQTQEALERDPAPRAW